MFSTADSRSFSQLIRKYPMYHIRITSPELDLQRTFDIFTGHKYVLVAEEGDNNDEDTPALHHHIMVSVLSHSKSIKDSLNQRIRNVYSELPKGNPGISISIVRNHRRLAAYTLKNGSFKFQGFSNGQILKYQQISFDQKSIKKQFTELLDDLLSDEITYPRYCVDYIKLKADSNQPIAMHHVRAHWLSVAVRKRVVKPEAIVGNYLDNIQQYNNMYYFDPDE